MIFLNTPLTRFLQVQLGTTLLSGEPPRSEMTFAPTATAQAEGEATESKGSEARDANEANEPSEANGQAAPVVKAEETEKEEEAFSWL